MIHCNLIHYEKVTTVKARKILGLGETHRKVKDHKFWERTRTSNIGLEFEYWKPKVNINFISYEGHFHTLTKGDFSATAEQFYLEEGCKTLLAHELHNSLVLLAFFYKHPSQCKNEQHVVNTEKYLVYHILARISFWQNKQTLYMKSSKNLSISKDKLFNKFFKKHKHSSIWLLKISIPVMLTLRMLATQNPRYNVQTQSSYWGLALH